MSDLSKFLKDQGFQLQKSLGKHNRWTDGKITIIAPRSSSDYRAILNMQAFIKRKRKQ